MAFKDQDLQTSVDQTLKGDQEDQALKVHTSEVLALKEKIVQEKELIEDLEKKCEEDPSSELNKDLVLHKQQLEELQERWNILHPQSTGLRTSSRDRKQTTKGAEYQAELATKKERSFFKRYGDVKKSVWKTKEVIQTETDEQAVTLCISQAEKALSSLTEAYEDLRKLKLPSQEVRSKMDKGSAMTKDSLNKLEEVLGSLGGPLVEEDRKELAQDLLNKDYASTVFGARKEDTVVSMPKSFFSDKVKLEGDIAAKEAAIKSEAAIQAQRLKLKELEDIQEVQAMKARLETYRKAEEESQGGDRHSLVGTDDGITSNLIHQNVSNPKKHKSAVAGQVFDTSLFAQALTDNMQRSRLPVPVPSTFSGNALEYMDFERSFMTLVDNRGIPPAEKLYYLKQYVSGPAREAIEGFFYGVTQEAYEGAWTTLHDRFGQPFKIQQAFRSKLDKWPKINVKDPVSLQKFADFLKSCNDAIPHIAGLEVLNDFHENQKLLNKLPEWIVSRWNRVVTDSLDQTGFYPLFDQFVSFVSKEARVANNPISSINAIKGNHDSKYTGTRDTPRGKGTSLKTKATEQDKKVNKKKQTPAQKPSEEKRIEYTPKPCSLCSKTDHQIDKCDKFLSKPLDDRKKYVQENRLCFGCLKIGHIYRECRRKLKCEECGRRHPSSLHEEREVRSVNIPKSPEETKEVSALTHRVVLDQQTSTSMIVPVWISSEQAPAAEILTYALLDTQSDSSFILEDVARSLSVKQHPVRLKLATMISSSTVNCNVVTNLTVRGMTQPTSVKLSRCYTREFIPVERDHIPSRKTAEAWPHLQDIANQIPALQDCEVGMLIGYNCPQALAPKETVIGSAAEPYAVLTELGWSIVGSQERQVDQQLVGQCLRVATREVPSLTPKEILRVLESDFAEKAHEDKAFSQEDMQFVKLLETNIQQCEDGHLEMPLPFRGRPELPNNRKLAMIRLQHLARKMERDENYKEHYTSFMKEIIDAGYAERAKDIAPTGSTNYIPHHGVYHPKKKDKLRVVFDCSAKYSGTSLNDHLLKGPDMTNGLVGVLCRFRKHEVALLCDIEKMFYQFRVCEEDRDFLRFLWWENGDIGTEPVEYRMTVHLFGAASSPGCANFGLKYLAKQHQKTYPEASRFIMRDFYVDDGVTSVRGTEEAIQLAKDAVELCKKGDIRLHKFISNNRVVVESIPKAERSKEVMNLNLDFDELPMERALGITWNPASDEICFEISLKEQPLTRRGTLSTVASLYDPLGLVAPVVLIGKRVLQAMCRSGIGWDDPMPDDLKPRWEQWLSELEQLKDMRIPRCYHSASFGQPVVVEIHHFSDASEMGYGQCSYLRLVNREGEVHCCLIFAKARVTPTKVVTIPRLELTAAVVSTKVSIMLREELEYQNISEFFWTDSTVVLGYISNEARRYHTFVANRVQAIREKTTPGQWKYIDSAENPADHASRGLSPAQLLTSRWFDGPKFLWEKNLELQNIEISHDLQIGDPEVKTVLLAETTTSEPQNLLERLEKFSDWTRVISGLTCLRRLVRKGMSSASVIQERRDTETFIVKMLQNEVFHEEVQWLAGSKKCVPSTSPLHNLNPYLDAKGVLRVGGRLNRSKMSEDVQHPIILPRNSHVTSLILLDLHQKIGHQGRGQTLNAVRANGYWVVNGSRAVAELVRNCIKCRRLRRPEEEQKMASLPEERVEPSAPFTYVGIDCFGPFKVKRGRAEVKRYGLLFTCFCSRGVHIEMLDDLSTDSFINGLRCFIAIRGAVSVIRCDQGSNFIGANNELKAALKEMDADKVKAYLAKKQCEFVFNFPHSSHVGGVWERQIRTIRNVLRATIDLCPGRLDDASLRTLLYEAMAIVNSRPLTTTNLGDPCAEVPITPNQLVTMKPTLPPPPPGRFVKEDLYARRRWRRVQYLLEQFWSRWRNEYVLNLQERNKWSTPRRNLRAGDVVLLKEPEVARMEWPLGVVESTTVDDDGLVRKVRVRVGSKNLDKKGRQLKQPSELDRPIQKLVLLKECV